MAPRKAKLRLKDRPGKGTIQPEPLGVALVIAGAALASREGRAMPDPIRPRS